MKEYKEIILSKGYTAKVDLDFPFNFPYRVREGKFGVYARRNTPMMNGKRKTVLLHKDVYEHYYGEIPEGLTVDHINRDTLDNRKSNLRLATRLQQNLNQAAHKNGLSAYKGVCWHKRDKVWTSSYCYQGKTINLGYFPNEVSAALAYDLAVYEAYKDTENLAFCYFNFPVN